MNLTREQVEGADQALRKLILEQGAKRLENQCAFVTAQESRAGILVGAAASLAGAAVAIAAGAFDKSHASLAAAAVAATLGFSCAAIVALASLWSANFDSTGWYPSDFANDLKKAPDGLTTDFVLDMQIRLDRNACRLAWRGRLFNSAAVALVLTPLVALLVAHHV